MKHSHPSTTGFAASSPGFPRSPGRWNPNFLKETLLKIILAALASLIEILYTYLEDCIDSWLWIQSRPDQTKPYLTFPTDLWTYQTYLIYLTDLLQSAFKTLDCPGKSPFACLCIIKESKLS